MALSVQDPVTPTALANSYQSLVDARALADLYGYSLPVDDTQADNALIKGFRYIENHESEMCGERTTVTQNTSWPRIGVEIRGTDFASDAFPGDLLIAQVVAADSYAKGADLTGGIDDGRVITKEKVDVLEVTYADNGKTGKEVSIPEFDSAIAPLLCCGGAFNPMVGRA